LFPNTDANFLKVGIRIWNYCFWGVLGSKKNFLFFYFFGGWRLTETLFSTLVRAIRYKSSLLRRCGLSTSIPPLFSSISFFIFYYAIGKALHIYIFCFTASITLSSPKVKTNISPKPTGILNIFFIGISSR
jgi:hypothetical protein